MITYRHYIPFGQNLDIFNHADRLGPNAVDFRDHCQGVVSSQFYSV